MNSLRPEAEPEYSRGPGPSRRGFPAFAGPAAGLPRPLRLTLASAGLAAAALLVAAEFAPLLTVRTSALGSPVTTVATSTHDAWALIPLALLTVFLSIGLWRTGSRLAMLALGVVGVVTILIALLGDLPDAQATGLVSQNARYAVAASSPAAGFYLETLAAAVLVIVAGAGLLLSTGRPRSVGGG